MDKDLQKKLEQWEKNKPVNRQLEELQRIAEDMGKVVKQLSYISTKSEKGVGDVGTLLMDIRESLDDLVSKEDPETPDFAEPVVKTLVKLEKSLTKALSGLDLSPNISVNAPDVKVDSKVDLGGVEKILKNDLPKAFDKAIKGIPKTEIPKNDYTPLVNQLKELSEKLDSIDTGVRLKPLPPSSIEISNFSDMTGGDASAANQVLQTALLTTIDADTGNIATEVAGLLTDTELRATPVPVSGTVTATPTGTQNVDVTANTIGLSTSANQTNGTQVAIAKGDVASGSADSGNPVKVGAKYNSTQPTFTDGQRADMQVDSRGNLRMGLYANNTQTTASFKADNADADAISATANKLGVMSRGTVYNGTTWDRQLGDATNGTLVNLGANNDVTVTSGAITETNSAAIKTAVETIDNAIAGSEMQVDVVGALPAGTNAIGKLSANSGVDIGDVDVTSSVSATLDHGSNLDIDTTAEQITTTSFAAKFGVTVKSAVDNTGTVYIGNSDVTAGTTAATDGFPLEPGESITLPVNNSNLLYAIGAAANQKVFWSAV